MLAYVQRIRLSGIRSTGGGSRSSSRGGAPSSRGPPGDLTRRMRQQSEIVFAG